MNLRAPPGRARAEGAAGQAPGRAGVWGQCPQLQYSKQYLDDYFHVARAHFQALYAQQARGRWWILEYGKMMRRLIDTKCRQVYE